MAELSATDTEMTKKNIGFKEIVNLLKDVKQDGKKFINANLEIEGIRLKGAGTKIEVGETVMKSYHELILTLDDQSQVDIVFNKLEQALEIKYKKRHLFIIGTWIFVLGVLLEIYSLIIY